MSSEKARELEQRGIEAARAGQKDQARKLLQHALRLDPYRDEAWLWLASVARDKRERLLCLQKVLEVNPDNEMAIKAVRAMGIDPERLIPERQSVEDALVTEDDSDAVGSVPIPDQDMIREAISRIDQVPLPLPDADDRIDWQRKEKGRTGEREIWILRSQIAAAVGTFSAIVLGAIIFAISNSPEVQLALFGASETPRPPTATSTPTLTPRPDINPTQTPTPDFTANPTFTPSPTPGQNVDAWPRDLNSTPVYATPTPTRLYLNAENNAISTAVAALEQEDNYEEAIDRMRQQQQQAGNNFEPYPYYYEAILLAEQNNIEGALLRLDFAQERLDDVESLDAIAREDARRFQPVVNAGYMNIYIKQIEAALEINNRGLADSLLADMEALQQQSFEIDPTYYEPYTLLSQAYVILDQYENAIDLITTGLSLPELSANPLMYVVRGEAYLARGRDTERRINFEEARTDYARAEYEGYLGVYVNPFSEAAHRLRIEATLALENPALASIRINSEYLFYIPESAEALRLLANTRLAEEKPDFALTVFTEALGLEGNTTELAQVYLSRAELYLEQRRYELALQDLTRVLDLNPTLSTRYLRMQAAYNAGEIETAFQDAETLIDAGYTNEAETRLIRARIIVDTGLDDQFDTALNDLVSFIDNLPPDLRHISNEYQARVFLQRGDTGDALAAIDRAIGQVETGSRRYLRAQIYEERDERDNAIAEYEFLLTWDQVFDYAFGDEVVERLEALADEIEIEQQQATATAAAATQAVIDVTATFEAEITPTATPEDEDE